MCNKIVLAVGFASLALFAAETRVQMKDLPQAVQNTVQEQTRNAKLRGLSKEIEDGKTYYEAETTVDGKSRDILIDPTGAVVEVETPIALQNIPQAAQQALKNSAGAGKILSVESVARGSVVSYEAVIQKGAKKSEVAVNADGSRKKED